MDELPTAAARAGVAGTFAGNVADALETAELLDFDMHVAGMLALLAAGPVRPVRYSSTAEIVIDQSCLELVGLDRQPNRFREVVPGNDLVAVFA